MHKLPFLTNERLSRLVVSLMLCLGLLLPLMFTFGAGSAAVQAALTSGHGFMMRHTNVRIL